MSDRPARNALGISAFTILELLVVLVVIGVLIALAAPSLRTIKSEMTRLRCVANISQVNRILLSYTNDSRGMFLARYKDDPNTLDTPKGLARYRGQLQNTFYNEPWRGYSGLAPYARVLRCPASQHDTGNPIAFNWPWDYVISSSTLITPDYLDPTLPASVWSTRTGARVQNIDGVLFPSAKALVYEETVWHAWNGYFSAATDLREVMLWGRVASPASLAFADGSAAMIPVASMGPFVLRAPDMLSMPCETTEWGIRGRDR